MFRHKSEVLEQHCKEVGTDFGAITRSGNYNVVIGETEKDVAERLDWIESHYRPLIPADALERYSTMFRNGPLVGTPEQLVEKLREAEGLGLTYAIVNFAEAAYDRAGIELFERQVVPELV